MKTPSKKNILVAGAVVLAAGYALTYHDRSPQAGSCCPLLLPASALAAEAAETPATNAPAKAGLPRLIDLGADKCIPCRMMMPVLKELKEEYHGRMEVVFIDVWKNPEAGKAYRVQLIPTQIFFDASGKELFRHQGFFAKAEILAKWAELGVEFKEKAPAGKPPAAGSKTSPPAPKS